MNNNRFLLCMYIHANEKFCVISRKSRFYFRTFRVITRKCNFSPTKIRSISFRRVGIWLYQISAAIFMLICETIPCQFRTFIVKKLKQEILFLMYLYDNKLCTQILQLYQRLTTKTSGDYIDVLRQKLAATVSTLARVAIISKSYDKTSKYCFNILQQRLAAIVSDSTLYNINQQRLG